MEIRTKAGRLVRTAIVAPWQWSAAASVVALVGAFVGVPMLVARDPTWAEIEPDGTLTMLVVAALFGFAALLRSIFREHESAARTPPIVERRSQPGSPRASVDDSTFWQQHRERRGLEPVVDVHFHELVTPRRWSLELLRSLDAKRFADVVAAVFVEHGFRIEPATHEPHAAVDARIFFRDEPSPVGVVRCMVEGEVGVALVSELLDVMLLEDVDRGHFVVAGGFTNEAVAFVSSHPIRLVPGADLLATIAQLDTNVSARLLAATTG